jgi:hydroxyethylthiazole kinase-like uncharacterized protein yjeF
LIPILTTEASREYDRFVIDTIGIGSSLLMERAAAALFEHVSEWLLEEPQSQIVIFCGKGNNGGDGIALARLLTLRSITCKLALVGGIDALSTDAAREYAMLSHIEGAPEAIAVSDAINLALSDERPLIIVDALLGTGAHGSLRDEIRSAVIEINKLAEVHHAKVLAVDIPTGLNADTGQFVNDAVVKATKTVTIVAPKLGFYLNESASVLGEVVIATLADREDLQPNSSIHLIERSDVKGHYPRPEHIASKFDFGHVLTVCGSRGMTGAAIMGAEAALRSGCGLVTVATAASERKIVAQAMPEFMTVGLPETPTGSPSIKAWSELEHFIERADVLLIGSGMKPEPETADLLRKILREAKKPIVADAGALHALADDLDILKQRNDPTVLTPHSGELAKMMHLDRSVIEQDRMNYAKTFAMEHRVTVVIKGSPTFTISPMGEVFVNSTGNVGLATAGSGDVLGGMIAGLFARMKDQPTEAAWLSVYLHGMAGDLAKAACTTVGMTARDVTMQLGATYKSMGFE